MHNGMRFIVGEAEQFDWSADLRVQFAGPRRDKTLVMELMEPRSINLIPTLLRQALGCLVI
jgi:hypothetical protein